MVLTLRQGYVCARKAHQCQRCKRIIEPGEVYFVWVGLVDGEFFASKEHSSPADECPPDTRALIEEQLTGS